MLLCGCFALSLCCLLCFDAWVLPGFDAWVLLGFDAWVLLDVVEAMAATTRAPGTVGAPVGLRTELVVVFVGFAAVLMHRKKNTMCHD